MNVLFVVPWDNVGGVSHVVNRVAEHMRAAGHGAHYLLPGDAADPEPATSRAGFPAVRMRLRTPRVPGRALRSGLAFAVTLAPTLWRLAALLRRLRIDVVNVHYVGDAAIHFALLRRLGVVRLVASAHGADLLPDGARVGPLPVTAAVLRAADAAVMPSDSYRAALREQWPEIRCATHAIPNGIDPAELEGPADEPAPAAPYVLSIAQLVHYKGIDVLIGAFAAVADRYPVLRLRLVSDGPQRQEYERLAAALGVSHRVDFLGFIDRAAISAELRGCTVFVLASRSSSESFGIAAAEAMTVNRAVIASRVGGLPELVQDGLSGLLVPPGDTPALEAALVRLLDDEPLRARLGRAAGERIRRDFRWARTGEMYERVFADVVRGAGTRGDRSPIPAGVASLPAARHRGAASRTDG